MEVLQNSVFLFLGLCVGSFLNVVVYRLPRKLNIIWGRSFCPKCRKKISWFDNLPLLSFFLLKGRCRACHSPISWRYPVVELLTGALFVLGAGEGLGRLGKLGGLGAVEMVLIWILFSALIVIFFIDLGHRIIPDKIVFPLITLFFIYYLMTNPQLLMTNYLMTAFISFFFFLLLLLFTRGRGMGFGDVKLAFLMGLVLGYPKIILAFYLAFLTGAIIGIILILAKKARFGQAIAFGPFLALATIITCLWGEEIISLATKLLF